MLEVRGTNDKNFAHIFVAKGKLRVPTAERQTSWVNVEKARPSEQKSKFVVFPGFCVDFDSRRTRYVSINCPYTYLLPTLGSFGFKCTFLQLRFVWSLDCSLLVSDFSNCSWPLDLAPLTRPTTTAHCHSHSSFPPPPRFVTSFGFGQSFWLSTFV